MIKHPEYFVAADETGDNTNMSDDNKRSGGKVVGATDSNLNANISTFDCHFTVVPFLGSHGKPILCFYRTSPPIKNASSKLISSP